MTTSRPPGGPATARAHANIALVKYWGKRDAALNLPAEGSLSLTLGALTTTATVRFDEALAADRLVLDGAPAAPGALARMSEWLDLVRAAAKLDWRADVVSANDFPTASGLASSASAYAALALAASAAAGLELDGRALSILARRGSGSAARSIYGGFVRMEAGRREDGADAFASPIASAMARDLAARVRMVVAVVGGGIAKKHGSRDAMEHCAETSPLYAGWLASVPGDLDAAEAAIADGDVHALGRIAEGSALAMHAAAMASRPAVIYFQPPTLACMAAVEALRGAGRVAYYTMDAGPHVKVLTVAADADDVAAALRAVPGVTDTIVSAAGEGASLT
jgi:diphosphomevalonate decarboxylase